MGPDSCAVLFKFGGQRIPAQRGAGKFVSASGPEVGRGIFPDLSEKFRVSCGEELVQMEKLFLARDQWGRVLLVSWRVELGVSQEIFLRVHGPATPTEDDRTNRSSLCELYLGSDSFSGGSKASAPMSVRCGLGERPGAAPLKIFHHRLQFALAILSQPAQNNRLVLLRHISLPAYAALGVL